jgi:hypothetical protein
MRANLRNTDAACADQPTTPGHDALHDWMCGAYARLFVPLNQVELNYKTPARCKQQQRLRTHQEISALQKQSSMHPAIQHTLHHILQVLGSASLVRQTICKAEQLHSKKTVPPAHAVAKSANA